VGINPNLGVNWAAANGTQPAAVGFDWMPLDISVPTNNGSVGINPSIDFQL
jgi:hypothetical protein